MVKYTIRANRRILMRGVEIEEGEVVGTIYTEFPARELLGQIVLNREQYEVTDDAEQGQSPKASTASATGQLAGDAWMQELPENAQLALRGAGLTQLQHVALFLRDRNKLQSLDHIGRALAKRIEQMVVDAGLPAQT